MGIFLTTGNLGKIATMGWRRVTVVIGIIGAVATSMDGATFLLQSLQVNNNKHKNKNTSERQKKGVGKKKEKNTQSHTPLDMSGPDNIESTNSK